ncbi:MAG: discoidin domain-containing protein, partial [Chitinispirillaceae bacterium]|nr:discoidin domain-containing protein [Chitinispirillaceae bacterium]
AVDGDLLTRWSAQGYPQWIELDLGAEKALKGIDLHFLENRAYQYTLQTKLHEGDSYSTVIDSSGNRVGGKHVLQLDNISVRYVRLNVTGASGYTGDWISVSDMRVYGDDVTRVSRTPDRPASRIWTETVDGGAVVLFIPSAGTGEQLGYSLSTLDGRNIVEKTEPIGPNNRIRILSGRERGVMKSTTGLYLLQYRIISGDKTKSSGASYILLPVTSLSLRQR